MADQTAVSDSAFRMPANTQEFTALGAALVAVFALIQLGAPLIRELEFLDPKLRDYFIGVSFAAFPLIHRQCKRSLSSFSLQEVARHDLAPWFVSGILAAALLFAWNQFVSFLGGAAMGLAIGQVAQNVNLNNTEIATALMMSILIVSVPLSAVAAVFAGVQLNRNTRSHTFMALTLASVFFVVFNVFTNWVLEPALLEANWNNAVAQGEMGIVGFFVGLFLVGLIIYVFGLMGIVFSRLKRERTIGRLVEAARHLPREEREALADEIADRVAAAAPPPAQRFTPPPPGAEP